jgi:16S rRNA (guanine527-N7)-methyltransferase
MDNTGSFNWTELAATWGLAVTPPQPERLEELARWLAERAYPLGFTNYPTAEALVEHHIVPTLALFRLFPPPLTGRVLDLGAGSGVLGLTLALLCPDLQVVLADRRRRSVQFIRLTVARLGLRNASAEQVGAGAPAKSSPGVFDLVCFRALAPAAEALRLAGPLLAPGGSVAAWHQSEAAAFLNPPPGWERLATAPTSLPALSVSRFRRIS